MPENRPSTQGTLVFSIVVPTYQRPHQLRGLLEAVALLDYPRQDFEVIVVDDGGGEPLDRLVGEFATRVQIKLLRQEHGGVSKARQNGAVASRGEFLAFTDDDCRPDRGWLRVLERVLRENPGCAAGGQTVNGLPDNPYATASQTLITYLYLRYNADPRRARFFAHNNVAIPAALYREAGGLDSTWEVAGEDRDFWDRWIERGFWLLYAPQAIIHHCPDLTFGRFWRQHLGYGRGAHRFRRAGSRRSGAPMRLETFAFYLRLMLHPFSERPWRQALTTSALLVVAQLATLSGFLWDWVHLLRQGPTRAAGGGRGSGHGG